MDILTYVIAAAVYVMVVHFALAIKNEFNIFLMITYFVIGFVVGYVLHALEIGFILAVILSLVLW